MKAIVFDRPGDESVLRLSDVDPPTPGPGEILIDVEATAVNRADLYQRQGQYPPPPGASPILGLECAGRVAVVGAAVRRWRPGDRVMALLPGGGYAGQAVADQGSVIRVPEGFTWAEAGAFPEVFLTAFLNIFRLGRAAAGQSVLVHGGGSGVGTAAIALAREAGVTIFVTAGDDGKRRRCLELGAAGAFDYKGDWAADLLGATDGRGVDMVLDPIGGRYLAAHLSVLAPGGRLLAIGGMGGVRRAELDFGLLMSKRIEIIGSTLRSRPVAEKAAIVLDFEERFGPALAAGRLRPVIAAVFPLADAARAHRLVQSSAHFGKVVLEPGGESP